VTTLIRHRPRPWVAGGALFAAAALAAAAALPGLGPDRAGASSHREAPRILGLPQYDNTDVYAFVSPDKPDTTTLIANWVTFEVLKTNLMEMMIANQSAFFEVSRVQFLVKANHPIGQVDSIRPL